MRALALSLALGSTALAQSTVPGFELERLRLNPGATSTLPIDSADLLPRLQLRVALAAHYQHDPLVLIDERTSSRVGSVVRSRLGFHLSGGFGVTDWLEVGLQVPVIVWQAGDELSGFQVSPVSSAAALGTPWVSARAAPLQQARGAALDLALGLGLGLPLGSDAALTRDPSVTAAPSITAGRSFGEFVRVGGGATFLLRPARALTTATQTTDEVGSYATLGAGVALLKPVVKPELSLRLDLPFTRSPVAGELLLGLRSPKLGPFEFFAVGGPGFGQQPGTPAFRVLLGAAWVGSLAPTAPPAPVDACASATPPVECPNGDLDGDGVVNSADACRTVMGLASLQGCPDVDADGDGVLDSEDACRGVRGTKARKGCAAPDADGDGLDDDLDKCPAVAGVIAFFGCPDGDGDGIEDAKDACPTEPGRDELKGCPDRDTDGDGVVDRLDGCVKDKGPPANQGCPAKEKQLVVITRERLIIRDKVYFDTGKSVVLPKSLVLLKQIARVLQEHPEIEHVSIEGHTDDRGAHEMNLKLSDARAASVRKVLLEAGVDAARITSKGYGPDRPVMPNTSAAGREVNRRVEFVIVGAETEVPSPAAPPP